MRLKSKERIDLLNDIDDVSSINTEYYLNHSGDKYITKMYQYLIDQGNMTTEEILDFFADTINIKFASKWNRLYQALESDYDPIENYNMEEDENVGSDTTSTTNGESGVSGFNSPDYAPSQSNDITVTSKGDFEKNHRKLKRHGNIGVTSSQQLIESEIVLREKILYNVIYRDIDSILCQEVY